MAAQKTIRIGRREFTARGLMILLSGVTVTIASACGGSSSPAAPSSGGSPSSTADVTGTVSENHGHIAVITGAQITARNAVTLHIQGNATHDHTVDLSSAQVAQIASAQRVAMTSSTDQSHSHLVTFN